MNNASTEVIEITGESTIQYGYIRDGLRIISVYEQPLDQQATRKMTRKEFDKAYPLN